MEWGAWVREGGVGQSAGFKLPPPPPTSPQAEILGKDSTTHPSSVKWVQ